MAAVSPQAAGLASDVALTAPQSPSDAGWKQVAWLPCTLSVAVAVPRFTLKDLLALRKGSVVSSELATSSNVPLRVNGELIAWCEFEALGNRLSVRLTELA